jgi:predicted  nucleic acid-binding Zn-ribbon protein
MNRIYTVFLTLLLSFEASAQVNDAEWPCIQVLIPEVVAGIVWPVEIKASQIGAWRNQQALDVMANRLNDLDEFTDSERQLIAEFAESLPEPSRADSLNKLADGIITLSNQRRQKYISGIKRYTRQQNAIAKQIEASLNLLAETENNIDLSSQSSRAEIKETLAWHQRVFDQREHAISSLCDRPVELEEKLSAVLRELAQYLP